MKKLFIIIFVLIHSVSLYSQLSWEKKIVNSTLNFEIVQFLNSQTGYISGNHVSNYWSSNIYKTTNSGNDWFTTGLSTVGRNSGIYFINASTGLASKFNPPGFGTLIRTGDGGISWQIIKTLEGDSPSGVYFFDVLNCYYFYSSLNKSTDSGFNWLSITGSFEHRAEMLFVDTNNGYFCTDVRLYRTTNGGYIWNQIYYTNYLPTINDLVFLDSLNGYFAGKLSTGAIFKTTNGGYNWNLVFTTTERLRKVIFPTYNVGYALGDSNRIYRTSNAGNNWISQYLDS